MSWHGAGGECCLRRGKQNTKAVMSMRRYASLTSSRAITRNPFGSERRQMLRRGAMRSGIAFGRMPRALRA